MVVESPWGSVPAPTRAGRAVTMLSRPEAAAAARVDSWHGRGTPFYVALTVMGTLGFLFGVLIAAVELAVVLH
jgi:hypothetical protein